MAPYFDAVGSPEISCNNDKELHYSTSSTLVRNQQTTESNSTIVTIDSAQ